MSRAPVNQRIESALQLQPMTADQLALCLTLDLGTVRKHTRALRYARRLSGRSLIEAGMGRPRLVYTIREFCQPQKAQGQDASTAHIAHASAGVAA